MFTREQFQAIFGNILDEFPDNKFIHGSFDRGYLREFYDGKKPFDDSLERASVKALEFWQYLQTLDTINPNSKELINEFTEFAQEYGKFLHEVDDYYSENGNPKPSDAGPYTQNEILGDNHLLEEIFDNTDDPEALKDFAFNKFIKLAGLIKDVKVEEPEPEIKLEAAPAVDPEECANFKKLATALEKAKTFKNSQEYSDLITMCKALGNPEAFAGMGGNARKEMLAATGKKINDYISHKAKDGVKPNVFKKFAAVEALSKYLDKRLEPYKNEVINVGGRMNVDVSKLNLDFEEYRQSVPNDIIIQAEMDTCPVDYFVNIDPRQGVVQNNMYLATNLLRKVSFEYELKNINNSKIENDISSAARMFSDPKFAAAELSGKNMDIEANKTKENQNVL